MVQSAQKALSEKALALKQSSLQRRGKRGFSVEEFCEIYDVAGPRPTTRSERVD